MAERFKANVCGLSLAGIVGSNLAGSCMSVSCECCVLSGMYPCGEPITRPEESHRQWYVTESDLETSRMTRLWLAQGCCAREKKMATTESYRKTDINGGFPVQRNFALFIGLIMVARLPFISYDRDQTVPQTQCSRRRSSCLPSLF
jgi:hypothetical protein